MPEESVRSGVGVLRSLTPHGLSTACAQRPSGVTSLVVSHRAPLAILLLGVVLALTPIAHAAPTDPGWISGLYDDNDYDDVVHFIIGAVGAVDSGVLDPVGPVVISLGLIAPSRPQFLSLRPLKSLSTRAPPGLFS